VTEARARQLVAIGRWTEAEQALAAALADPGTGADPWRLLAQCRLAQGDPAAAQRAARRAISLDPEHEWGHRLLAIALLRRRRPRRALASARRSAALAPDQPHALNVLVVALLALDRRRAAERVAARSLAANPHSALAWHTTALVALGRRRWADAEQAARSGLRDDPVDPELLLDLGKALAGQRRHAEAGEAYRAAGRADPRNARARRLLGRVGLPVTGVVVFAGKAGLLQALILLSAVSNGGFGLVPLLVVAGGGVFAVQELRHRRARAQLAPDLRQVAARERRGTYRKWAGAATLLAALSAVGAVSSGSGVAVAASVLLLAVCGAVLVRLGAVPDLGLGPLAQRIRRRFR
jgi:tetratricopeptide (TPR) repeat protein